MVWEVQARFLWLFIHFVVMKSGLFQFGRQHGVRYKSMKDEYDFSNGKRGAIFSSKGKTRITIYLDDAILEEFRSRAENAGTGYQTLINDALKEYLGQTSEKPVTESVLRRVLQEEFPQMAHTLNPSP